MDSFVVITSAYENSAMSKCICYTRSRKRRYRYRMYPLKPGTLYWAFTMCRKICSVRYVLSCLLFPTTQRWVLSLFYLPDEETEVPSGDLTVRSHSQQVAELGFTSEEGWMDSLFLSLSHHLSHSENKQRGVDPTPEIKSERPKEKR